MESGKMQEPLEMMGQVDTLEPLDDGIFCLTIIGEIEGHMELPQQNKSTKYEHLLPMLASIEDSNEIQGVLLLLNTIIFNSSTTLVVI